MDSLAVFDLMEEGALSSLPLPITLLPPVPMSDEELIAFSRRNGPYRIEQNAKGELEIKSPVGGDGSEYEAVVIRHLGNWADEHGGNAFSSNGGFRLPDGSVLSPDAAWISEARWVSLSKEQRRTFPPLCPEFVVEIRSESDSRRILEDKMNLWISNGAQLAWMIDPYAETISMYRPAIRLKYVTAPSSWRLANRYGDSGWRCSDSGRGDLGFQAQSWDNQARAWPDRSSFTATT